MGESALVDLIGEDVLRAPNPQVATYARPDAVDVVVTAEASSPAEARRMAVDAVSQLRERVGNFVFAEGDQTWADALGARLGTRTLGTVEIGTAGQLLALLGGAGYLLFGELLGNPGDMTAAATDLGHFAQRVREVSGADIGLAVFARENRDTHVRIAIATADGVKEEQRVAFLGGEEGRRRAALSACAALWQALGRSSGEDSPMNAEDPDPATERSEGTVPGLWAASFDVALFPKHRCAWGPPIRRVVRYGRPVGGHRPGHRLPQLRIRVAGSGLVPRRPGRRLPGKGA